MANNSYYFQKQVVYAGFFSRILASIFDFFLLSILINPIIRFIENKIFKDITHPMTFFRNALLARIQNIDSTSTFWSKINNYLHSSNIIERIVLDFFIQMTIISGFIMLFWIKKQATPGRLIMKIKIVNATDLQPPTITQLISRLLGYCLSALLGFFGFILIGFNSKKKGLHDFIAGTIVIKN